MLVSGCQGWVSVAAVILAVTAAMGCGTPVNPKTTGHTGGSETLDALEFLAHVDPMMSLRRD